MLLGYYPGKRLFAISGYCKLAIKVIKKVNFLK
jgi:hypothetical protein